MPRSKAPEPHRRGPLPLPDHVEEALLVVDDTPVNLTHLQKALFPRQFGDALSASGRPLPGTEARSQPDHREGGSGKRWPSHPDGLRKRDLLDYNHDVADFLLPYLRDRPYTMLRYPDGIDAPPFFQKDAGRVPKFVRTVAVASANARGKVEFILCNDVPTLLYLVNLGCIDHHIWMSRAATPLAPDFVLLDLDPGPQAPFASVVRVAQAIRHVLDACELPACLKTSGATGLHVWIPLAPGHTFEQSQQFAALLLRLAAARVPELATEVWALEQRPPARVYLDFRQNAYGKTVPPPYSPRPRPGAPVSCPLRWSELRPSLDPARFTFAAIRRRLDRYGDLFAPLRPDAPREPLRAMLARVQRVAERRR